MSRVTFVMVFYIATNVDAQQIYDITNGHQIMQQIIAMPTLPDRYSELKEKYFQSPKPTSYAELDEPTRKPFPRRTEATETDEPTRKPFPRRIPENLTLPLRSPAGIPRENYKKPADEKKSLRQGIEIEELTISEDVVTQGEEIKVPHEETNTNTLPKQDSDDLEQEIEENENKDEEDIDKANENFVQGPELQYFREGEGDESQETEKPEVTTVEPPPSKTEYKLVKYVYQQLNNGQKKRPKKVFEIPKREYHPTVIDYGEPNQVHNPKSTKQPPPPAQKGVLRTSYDENDEEYDSIDSEDDEYVPIMKNDNTEEEDEDLNYGLDGIGLRESL